MSDDLDYVDVTEIPVNNLAIFQQEKATIERMMDWAKRYPRNELKIKNACIAMVVADKDLAAECTYSVPRSGNPTGPSIVLAKLILRKFGNVRAEQRVVGYDNTHVTCEAMVADLETNYAIRTQIRRSIMTNKGARFDETMVTTTGAAGCSIALRNAIFSVVDPSIVKSIHNAAKTTVLGKISTKDELIAAREKMVNGLKNLYQAEGLTDTEIAMSCGKKLLEHIDKEQMLILASIEVGLRKGEMEFDQVFRPKKVDFINVTDKSSERMKIMIKASKTRDDLKKLEKDITDNDNRVLYDEMWKQLK